MSTGGPVAVSASKRKPVFHLSAKLQAIDNNFETARTMKTPSLTHLLISAVMTTLGATAWAQQQPVKFPVISLNAGMHVIKAEVAARDAERQQGLMYRERMGPNEGMVFVFEAPAGVCMWMKNTLIPLSVAFIDESGKIINIEDMQPQTTDSHCTKRPARYALEMNQGWFKQKNIKPGMPIQGLPN